MEVQLLGETLFSVSNRLEALKQLNFICAQGLTSKCMLDIPAIKEGLTRIFKNGAPRELQQVFELLKHVQRSGMYFGIQ
jgi:hypothetical protein